MLRTHGSKAIPAIAATVAILAISLVILYGKRDFPQATLKLDPSTIERAAGTQGTFKNGTFHVQIKRPGLSTRIGGSELSQDFGLESDFYLSGSPAQALLLGDLALREPEVNSALRAALESCLTVTSLHNRFLLDSARIMSLHLEGTGTQDKLAQAMGKLASALRDGRFAPIKPPSAAVNPAKSALDEATMEKLLWKGELSNGVFRVNVGRGTTLKEHLLGELSGVSSWASFAGDRQNALVNGEIATLENELPHVLEDLISGNLLIGSIHAHMTQEKPKLVFVHFWGQGPLEPMAQAVKLAIWAKEEFQSQ